jgi:hypothetical protein
MRQGIGFSMNSQLVKLDKKRYTSKLNHNHSVMLERQIINSLLLLPLLIVVGFQTRNVYSVTSNVITFLVDMLYTGSLISETIKGQQVGVKCIMQMVDVVIVGSGLLALVLLARYKNDQSQASAFVPIVCSIVAIFIWVAVDKNAFHPRQTTKRFILVEGKQIEPLFSINGMDSTNNSGDEEDEDTSSKEDVVFEK